jgi:glutathione S-transferase
MKIYGDPQSGNCYKLQFLCSLLEIEYQWIPVNILNGETHTSDFLAKNPNAKIPVLELPDGRCITESNAILNYLAAGSDLLPTDAFDVAKVQEWQFFEQYSHEPFVAVARFIAKYLGLPEGRRADYESKQEGGNKALSILGQRLSNADYLVAGRLTTADLSLYAYTHVAEEGGFDLTEYPAVQAWLVRIASEPNYIGMA